MSDKRIPLHDHADGNAGGRLAPGTLAGLVDTSGTSGGSGFDGIAEHLVTSATNTDQRLAPNASGGVDWVTDPAPASNFLTRDNGERPARSTVSAAGAAQTLDLSTANSFDLALTSNCTVTLSNPPPSGTEGIWSITLRQGGTGSYTVTWPAAVKWRASNGTATTTAPTLATAVGAVDVVVLTTLDGGTTYGAALDNGTTAASPLTTKGDLYGRTSSADARLAVGTDGTFVMADSTATTGLSYALPRPLMVADTDGTHWNVLVDGDGNPVMAY